MSKHKVYTLYIIVGVTMLLAACTMPAKQQTVGNKARHQFTNEILLGYTPVKTKDAIHYVGPTLCLPQ